VRISRSGVLRNDASNTSLRTALFSVYRVEMSEITLGFPHFFIEGRPGHVAANLIFDFFPLLCSDSTKTRDAC
jgi:hypothetical protein